MRSRISTTKTFTDSASEVTVVVMLFCSAWRARNADLSAKAGCWALNSDARFRGEAAAAWLETLGGGDAADRVLFLPDLVLERVVGQGSWSCAQCCQQVAEKLQRGNVTLGKLKSRRKRNEFKEQTITKIKSSRRTRGQGQDARPA